MMCPSPFKICLTFVWLYWEKPSRQTAPDTQRRELSRVLGLPCYECVTGPTGQLRNKALIGDRSANASNWVVLLFGTHFNVFILFIYFFYLVLMCVFRKDKDMLEDKCKSNNLEREREQIDRIVKESGGKLTRRLVNSQVTGLFLCTAYCLVVCGLQFQIACALLTHTCHRAVQYNTQRRKF